MKTEVSSKNDEGESIEEIVEEQKFEGSLIKEHKLHVSLNIIKLREEQHSIFDECLHRLKQKFKNSWKVPLQVDFSTIFSYCDFF